MLLFSLWACEHFGTELNALLCLLSLFYRLCNDGPRSFLHVCSSNYRLLSQDPLSVFSARPLSSSVEMLFYADDKEGRASETGRCECVSGEGLTEGERGRARKRAPLQPSSAAATNQKRALSLLALRHDTQRLHMQNCQNHLDRQLRILYHFCYHLAVVLM